MFKVVSLRAWFIMNLPIIILIDCLQRRAAVITTESCCCCSVEAFCQPGKDSRGDSSGGLSSCSK